MLFLLSFSLLLKLPLWFPSWHFHAFAPYLMYRLHSDTRYGYLWRLFFCGLLVDLLSSSTYFGQTPLLYVAIGTFLHSQRHLFFIDKWPTLPLLTFLFTSLSTLGNALFDKMLHGSFPFTISWIGTDLFQMPLMEATFAFVFLSLPFQLREAWRKIQTKRRLRV